MQVLVWERVLDILIFHVKESLESADSSEGSAGLNWRMFEAESAKCRKGKRKIKKVSASLTKKTQMCVEI